VRSRLEIACLLVAQVINRLPAWLIVWIILILNCLTWIPSGDEENYLGLAKQFYNPSWIPNSINFTEFPGTRLWYQYIAGWMLSHLSFEWTVLIGRFVLSFFTAFPLGRLAKIISLTNLELAVVMSGFYLGSQAFFGHESIFLFFLTSNFAYVFVFWGLVCLFERRHELFFVCTILATYFHVLVGGWFLLAGSFYLVYDKSINIKKLGLGLLCYGIALSPWIWYLGQEVVAKFVANVDGVNLNWVYVYFRNPHHAGIFGSLRDFVVYHAFGVVLFLVFWIVTFFWKEKYDYPGFRKFAIFNYVTGWIVVLFLAVAIADRTGFILKFLPFRQVALFTMLSYFMTAYYVKVLFFDKAPQDRLVLFMLLPALSLNLIGLENNLKATMHRFSPEAKNLSKWVKENTRKDDVFIFVNSTRMREEDTPFSRMAERNVFVVFKFVPGGTSQMLDWYQRVLENDKADKNNEYLKVLEKKYKIDYAISLYPMRNGNFSLVFQNDDYFVYKL
jgi:hypothetical protein